MYMYIYYVDPVLESIVCILNIFNVTNSNTKGTYKLGVCNFDILRRLEINGPYSLLVRASYFYFMFRTHSICFRTIY